METLIEQSSMIFISISNQTIIFINPDIFLIRSEDFNHIPSGIINYFKALFFESLFYGDVIACCSGIPVHEIRICILTEQADFMMSFRIQRQCVFMIIQQNHIFPSRTEIQSFISLCINIL